MVAACPGLLGVSLAVWRRALAVLALLGVPGPHAVATNNSGVLKLDWLQPGRLASWLALAGCVDLSEPQTCASAVGYASYSPQRLACRLEYLRQCGALRLLVASKQAAKQQWRLGQGLSAGRQAVCEPAFISMGDLCTLADRAFLQLPALAADGSPDGYSAFQAAFPQSPAWRQLWATAEAKAVELRRQLPPELLAAAAEEEKEGEGAADEPQQRLH